MPNDLLCCAWAAKAFWRDRSERPSTNPSPNCIYRYAENDVVAGDLSGKVRLREDATRRVRAPLNREEIVHAAIRRSVGVQYEPRLPNRTIRGDEGRDHICGAIRVGIRDLWIGRGART